MFTQVSQHTLQQEINSMSERVRILRRVDAVGNGTQIKTFEHQLQTKWDELRALRAGSGGPGDRPREGSHLNRVPTRFLEVTDDNIRDQTRSTEPRTHAE